MNIFIHPGHRYRSEVSLQATVPFVCPSRHFTSHPRAFIRWVLVYLVRTSLTKTVENELGIEPQWLC